MPEEDASRSYHSMRRPKCDRSKNFKNSELWAASAFGRIRSGERSREAAQASGPLAASQSLMVQSPLVVAIARFRVLPCRGPEPKLGDCVDHCPASSGSVKTPHTPGNGSLNRAPRKRLRLRDRRRVRPQEMSAALDLSMKAGVVINQPRMRRLGQPIVGHAPGQ
jgi:hypothetical protein